MCLFVKKRPKPKKNINVYKVLNRTNTKLESPYLYTRYKMGLNQPQSHIHSNIIDFREGCMIEGGAIHAYTSLKRAKKALRYDRIILKLRVKPEDIVAFGQNQDIAIKSLYIPKRLYEKALGGLSW